LEKQLDIEFEKQYKPSDETIQQSTTRLKAKFMDDLKKPISPR